MFSATHDSQPRQFADHHGFTMIELLVALAIVAVMIVLMLMGQGIQISKGEDAARKNDLAKIKIALEDYYNDHQCYPPPELMDECYSDEMQPYLHRLPCDPRTREPYPYHQDVACRWYAVFTTLMDEDDPVITTLSCAPTCGVPGQPYNYVITNGSKPVASIVEEVGGQVPSPTQAPTPRPTQQPTETPEPGQFACDPNGQCNVYADPLGSECPVTFANPTVCQLACATPANRCAR